MSEEKIDPKLVRVTEGTSLRDTPNQVVNYTTITQMKVGAEEVILHFGHVDEDNPLTGSGFAKIYMSPFHAKRLLGILQNSVNVYERIFGEINADPALRMTAEGKQFIEERKAEEDENARHSE